MSDGTLFLGQTKQFDILFLDPTATAAASIPTDPSTTVVFRFTANADTSDVFTFGPDRVTRVATGDYRVLYQVKKAGTLEVRGEGYDGTTIIVDQKTYTVLDSAAYPSGTFS